MSNDKGMLIDGVYYDVPDVGTLTVDESEIFNERTGLVAEIVSMELMDGTVTMLDLLRNNGLVPALAMIAYRRKHHDLDAETIARIIGRTNRFDLFKGMLEVPEDEESPPSRESTRPPPEQSRNGSSDSTPSTESSPESSGPVSTLSSDPPDAPPDSTGTIGSDTSPMSAPARLVT